MHTLVIYGRLDNLNDYTKACRTQAIVGAKMKDKNESYISDFINTQLKGVHYPGKVKLAFRWYEPNRNRDLDNICFAKKFILDALKNTGVIVNDNWAHIEGFTDEFFVDKDMPRIEVDIERSSDENA